MKWINIKDKLPAELKEVLVFNPDDRYEKGIFVSYLSPYGDWDSDDESLADGITHWMPLPKPPKE